jgi:hypothetical protein
MAKDNGSLVFSTVPVGRDDNNNYIVTVHVAPQLGADDSPRAMEKWAADVVSGNIQFKLMSSELTDPIPATLDSRLIHPELWEEFLGNSSRGGIEKARPATKKSIDIAFAKVNLRDAAKNAHDFYNTYTPKIDVTDPKSVGKLYQATQGVAYNHSIYAVKDPDGVAAQSTTSVRAYLDNNLKTSVPVARIFGNINAAAAFPNANQPMMNPGAQAQIDKLHEGTAQDGPSPANGGKSPSPSTQHIIHHIHRMRSISRKAPANISPSSLNATASSKQTKLGTPMSFEQQLMLLQGMPVIMEALGLVLVFTIAENQDLSAVQKLKIAVSPSGSDGTYHGLSIVSPWTAVSSKLFLPLPDPTPATRFLNPVIAPDTGYIDVSADYEMGSLQLESATNHVYNFSNQAALRVNQHSAPQAQAQAVTRQFSEDYTHVILPRSPHTDGIYVYQHERQNKIRKKLAVQTPAKTLAVGSVLYAEDLFHSFAVDMLPQSEQNWVHLTLRDEQYFRRSDSHRPIISAQNREHGVRTSATRPTDSIPGSSKGDPGEAQRHQIDETLFTWRHGSLALKEDSGTSIGSYTKGKLSTQVIPWTDTFSGSFRLPQGVVIPEQLFGLTYLFALRPIYITGRARPFDAALAAKSTIPNPQPLQRNEMVLGPRLIREAGTGSKECDTQDFMLISSRVKNPQAAFDSASMSKLQVSDDGTIEKSVRYIVPAATTAAVARRHGMSEQNIKRGAKTVPLKKGEKGKGHGALPAVLPLDDSDIDDTTVYIPDPMCNGVRANLFYIGNSALPNSAHQLSQTVLFYSDGHKWPDYALHCVELRKGKPGSAPTLTLKTGIPDFTDYPVVPRTGSKTIVCTLPPGMTGVLELTPTIDQSARDVHAFKPKKGIAKNGAQLEDTNTCRPTVLRMTYATDVPVTIPSFVLDGAVQVKDAKNQPAKIDGKDVFIFDRPPYQAGQPDKPPPSVTTTYEPYTTSKISIDGAWTEIVDKPGDIQHPEPTSLLTKATFFTRQLPKLQSNTAGSQIGAAYYSDSSCPLMQAPAGTPVPRCERVTFPFTDTRYRRVQLAITGVARHANVLRQGVSVAPATREVIYEIRSTAPPPVPDVEYLMPTFEWDFQKKSGLQTQTRKSGLAVMLNRPWFASGNGEQLAVLLPAAFKDGRPLPPNLNSLQLPSQYPPYPGSKSPSGIEEQVSAWGTHAIWRSVEDNRMNISLENAVDCQRVTVKNQSYNVALFNPMFDEVEQRWYCNLSFSRPLVYGTLMRLVVARYQANSVSEDVKLSEPVVTDFALLNPTRVLRVKKSGKSLEVTVMGIGAYDTSNNLLTRFDVRLATEKEDPQTFQWREDQTAASQDSSDPKRQILWHGFLNYDHFKANAIVVREYEPFPAFETMDNKGSSGGGSLADTYRYKLVYASTVEIRPSLI